MGEQQPGWIINLRVPSVEDAGFKKNLFDWPQDRQCLLVKVKNSPAASVSSFNGEAEAPVLVIYVLPAALKWMRWGGGGNNGCILKEGSR